MTALYIERYLNYGLSLEELQSDRPIIGIAQSGSDLVPCNRHHLVLADRVREGIRDAGGIAIEFPTHPIQETRSEEHTSELQSLMRISYAVFCLKKKTNNDKNRIHMTQM